MMKRMEFYKVFYWYSYVYHGVEVRNSRSAHIGIDIENPFNDEKLLNELKDVVKDVYKNDTEFAELKAYNFGVDISDFLSHLSKHNTIKYVNKVLMTDDYIFIA